MSKQHMMPQEGLSLEARKRSVKTKNLYHFIPLFGIGATKVKTVLSLNS